MEDQVRETLTRLLTDESQSLKRLVVTADRLLRIDRDTGEMVLTTPRLFISDRDFIGLLLLSKYFAYKLGMAKKESMTMTEVIQRSGLDETIVSSRLIELGYRGIVDRIEKEEFSISYAQAQYFLEEAIQNMLVARNRSELSEQGSDIVGYLGLMQSEESLTTVEARRRAAAVNRGAILVLTSRRII